VDRAVDAHGPSRAKGYRHALRGESVMSARHDSFHYIVHN
jgi:hypothetical protein